MFDTDLIDQVSRFHVVGGIQHHIHIREQCFRIPAVQVRDHFFYLYCTVHLPEPFRRCKGFGNTLLCVLLGIENLPLEVIQLHRIPVDQPQISYSRPGKKICLDAAQRTHPHDGCPGGTQLFLAFFSDVFQHSLSRVAIVHSIPPRTETGPSQTSFPRNLFHG